MSSIHCSRPRSLLSDRRCFFFLFFGRQRRVIYVARSPAVATQYFILKAFAADFVLSTSPCCVVLIPSCIQLVFCPRPHQPSSSLVLPCCSHPPTSPPSSYSQAKKLVENALLSKLQEAQAQVEETQAALAASEERAVALETDRARQGAAVSALTKQLQDANRSVGVGRGGQPGV